MDRFSDAGSSHHRRPRGGCRNAQENRRDGRIVEAVESLIVAVELRHVRIRRNSVGCVSSFLQIFGQRRKLPGCDWLKSDYDASPFGEGSAEQAAARGWQRGTGKSRSISIVVAMSEVRNGGRIAGAIDSGAA